MIEPEDSRHGHEVSGRSDDAAAKKAGFESRRSYRDAKTVVEHAEPELGIDPGRLDKVRAPGRSHPRRRGRNHGSCEKGGFSRTHI
jgi:hypothetical protein